MTNNRAELEELEQLIAEAERRKKYFQLATYFPAEGNYARKNYPHAIAFFEAGSKYRARCFVGGNRSGKSASGSYETTLHATGRYPKWWKGRRFKGPTKIWCAGITNETTKGIIQNKLVGSFMDLGTGMIPKEDIIRVVSKAGIAEAISMIYVKHYDEFGIEDGVSTIELLSYVQGRDKFQGTAVHFVWLDEEPSDPGIYEECIMRTMETGDSFEGGILCLTFTPLLGLSKVVLQFLPGGRLPIDGINPETKTWATMVEWDDVPHLSTEAKEELIAKIPPWMRDARTRGIPQIGAGAIYPVSEADITVEPFAIPLHWPKVYAMDVGWNRTAVIWAAQDPTDYTWYIYSEYYVGREEPPLHAEAIKTRGKWIPGVIDPASNRSRDDGSRLMVQYLDLGLDLHMARNNVEAGISMTWQMMATGQLKIFSTCQNWFKEFRTYHRDEDGKIPKGQDDHLMDCTKYLVLSGIQIAIPFSDMDDTTNDDALRNYRPGISGSTTGY